MQMSPVDAHADMHEEFDGANDDLLSHVPAIASLSPAAETGVDNEASSRSSDCGGLSVAHFPPVLPTNAPTAPFTASTTTTTTIISEIADDGNSGVVVGVSENDTERHAHAHAQAIAPPVVSADPAVVVRVVVPSVEAPPEMDEAASAVREQTVPSAEANSTATKVVSAAATVSVTAAEDHLGSGTAATGTDHASPDALPAPVVGDTTPTSEAPTGDAAAAKKRKQASKKARRRVIEMDN